MDVRHVIAGGVPCTLYLSRKRKPKNKGTVVYLHGGGLIYGSASDYPQSSMRLFLDAGYDFLSIGYPLAPETPLVDIISAVESCLGELIGDGTIEGSRYYAFGRSAGVFLWTAVLSRIVKRRAVLPQAFLAFYGYSGLSYFNIFHRDSGYRGDISIEESTAFGLIRNHPVFDDPDMSRVLLYIFARQQGLMGVLLGVRENELDTFSYGDTLHGMLPPTFAAYCDMDPEINPSASLELCSLAAESEAFVVKRAAHDFDQNTELPESRQAVQNAIAWLDLHSGNAD